MAGISCDPGGYAFTTHDATRPVHSQNKILTIGLKIMSVNHYENFPVASVLLPRRLRPAVESIYAFARSADDIADEGNATPAQRLRELKTYRDELDSIEVGRMPASKIFQPLAKIICEYELPLHPFRNLLSAFEQDVVTQRYATYAELLDYCRRSANPVGELMLLLYDAADTRNRTASDAICSALQLINFCQDVAIDLEKNRIYLPLEDLDRFGLSEDRLCSKVMSRHWRELMAFQIERTRSLLEEGAPLALRLPGRIGWELRLVVQGGFRILEKIEAVGYDVFNQRPSLSAYDWTVMFWRALSMHSSPDSRR